jgi:hypothetical protein
VGVGTVASAAMVEGCDASSCSGHVAQRVRRSKQVLDVGASAEPDAPAGTARQSLQVGRFSSGSGMLKALEEAGA